MKRAISEGLILLCLACALAAGGDGRLTPADLAGKTLAQLYLMRNEIYARHGRPFKTSELDTYFSAQKWYQRDLAYDDSRLTPVDRAEIETIRARELDLLKYNYHMVDGCKEANLDNVINLWQFPRLTPAEAGMLGRNGFLVLPAVHEQFFYLYEENSYQGIASFVTADAILQLYHVFFDYTLRHLEEERLYPTVTALTGEMLRGARETFVQAEEAKTREAARRNLAFFTVADCLFAESAAKADKAVAAEVRGEIERCKAHAARAQSLIFNPAGDAENPHAMEYTLFQPRGHYTRSKALQRYFLGMSWYGCNYFLADRETDLLQSLLLTRQLYAARPGKERLIDLWRRVYEPTAFYAGTADKLGPEEYKSLMDEVYGPGAPLAALASPAKLRLLRDLARKLYAVKAGVHAQTVGVPPGPQFRFMGQRYIPDAEILQRLSKWPERPFPKGLDVMAVLGSAEARDILLTGYREGENWRDYPKRLAELQRKFGGLREEEWRKNLYYSWLYSLRALLTLNREGRQPFFSQSPAWPRKNLVTSLASWTEMRHDTILYGEASACEGEGEEWTPEPPKGFVEPNEVFFRRLRETLDLTERGLKQRQVLSARLAGKFRDFKALVAFLAETARKELAGQPLSLSDYERIERLGTSLELLTISVVYDNESANVFAATNDADRRMALVADVHTSAGRVLEEAVGPAFEIYVVVESDGYLKLARGGVFSYHEFTHPAADRLTDEKWQALLAAGKNPVPPDWTKVFVSDTPAREMPARYPHGY